MSRRGIMRDHPITRRHALLSLPAMATASAILAQSSKPPIRVRSLNHMTLTVSDQKRSVEFYQAYSGCPFRPTKVQWPSLRSVATGNSSPWAA
jgi:hypothetical protein